ncbi:MAG: CBS domain-containing protein [Chloroflexi bacterium]|nr:CBS domain-containing protein [Chloroflexota bacterium]
MHVHDIMTKNPVTVHQNKTLRRALELMDSVGCHHLPVIDDENHLMGILSDRDCRKALNSPQVTREHWETAAVIDNIRVRDLMTPGPIIIEPTATAREAARLMLTHHISCLPVMRSETIVGIITTSDIMMAFLREPSQRRENGHG